MSFGFGNIFKSTWLSLLLLAVAAVGLVLLYLQGRKNEAMAGAALLVIAALLIYHGSGKNGDDEDPPSDPD